jgi:hypothetical protein
MALKFNPLTAQFDLTGSGGGGGSAFFAGEVPTYADLPLDGTAALDSRWLVRSNSGTWPFSSYKQAGVYVRIATVGSSRDNDYRLTDTSFFDVMSDSAFLIYDDGDATKNLKFQLSGIPTASTVTLTAPAASGTIARTSDIPSTFAASAITSGVFDNARINFAAPDSIGSTTRNSGAFTTLSAAPTSGSALTLTGGTVTASAPLISATQTWNNAAVTFTGLLVNVTNTNSSTASNFASFEISGVQQAFIRRDGRIVGANVYGGGAGLESSLLPQGVAVGNAAYIGFCSSTFANDVNGDLRLFRDAANVLAQRNGTNSQEARLYGTFTSSTNYQRMTVKSVRQTLSALSGASATTTGTFIPDGAVVVGVTTRVATLLTGAAGYTIGDGTDADRWGDITGTAVGTTSDNRDWTAGTIECFTAGGNVTLTAKTANFTAGAIEVCVFYLAGEAD